uniref:Uncharacterized protein n=1 Tax=Arundo donax TaxID=35708 RepID=A0A0A9DLK3_ARUDO
MICTASNIWQGTFMQLRSGSTDYNIGFWPYNHHPILKDSTEGLSGSKPAIVLLLEKLPSFLGFLSRKQAIVPVIARKSNGSTRREHPNIYEMQT